MKEERTSLLFWVCATPESKMDKLNVEKVLDLVSSKSKLVLALPERERRILILEPARA